jgi:hypothetical protein
MGVTVRTNQSGNLALRIRHHGRDEHVGTKLRDDGADGPNRKNLHARAILIADDLRKGRPLHRALLAHLGSCPTKLLPQSERPDDDQSTPTVGVFYDTWIPRQQPPDVRPSTAKRHQIYFESLTLCSVTSDSTK